MSGSNQDSTSFGPAESRLIIEWRGRKDWNSRYRGQEPGETSTDDFDLEGPLSFEVIAQVITKNRNTWAEGGPFRIAAEDIEAEYPRLQSTNTVDFDEVMEQLEPPFENPARTRSKTEVQTAGKGSSYRRGSKALALSAPKTSKKPATVDRPKHEKPAHPEALTDIQKWILRRHKKIEASVGSPQRNLRPPETEVSSWMKGVSPGYKRH
ncbi:MAG: hypothetical protein Q9213_001402 [Squamulea squamosa]